MAKIALFVLCALFSISLAQNRRYRPFPAVTVVNNEGRYRGSSDGRYVSDNSGRYDANDGRYVPDESGRYNPDGSGRYAGGSGKYNPDGAGRYSGENGRYNGDGSGRYSGSNEKYQGDKYGSGAGGSGGVVGAKVVANAGSRFGAGLEAGLKEALIGGGFSKPVALKQGSAAGKYDNRNYAILRQEGTVEEDGYHYLYDTENGITGEEQGKLHNRGTDDEVMKASGFYTYTGPDNVIYTVRYTADENGFIPEGDHLPTPPPIPEAIARALEYQRQQGTL